MTTPNRLSNQQSAYLRSAASQPVVWYPWGEEAFDAARAADKPILLDIGAVWCHWCHVMDHESYEDPAVAEILNRDWICIKVDRDERPDVDARYQRAVQAITGQGGWPLTAFLTPEGEVFYGGTYFPPAAQHGRPGFATVLTELARRYREDRATVVRQAAEIRQHLRSERADVRAGPVSPGLVERGADAIARVFDFRNGGFGTQPKFPHPAACVFLLARWFDTGETWAAEIVDRTLRAMARGGIRDHVGGGFHRYSVDARWIVPHFEKMAHDNSELLRAYVHAATSPLPRLPDPGSSPTGDPEADWRPVIDGVAQWVWETLSDPEGGYFGSQDADVGLEDDGDYFTWTPDEVRAVVTPQEFDVLARRFDIDEAGEMHHNPNKNVLWIRQSVAQIATALDRDPAAVVSLLESGIAKLREARRRRPTPYVDRTLYTGWNAMMASAMLEAAPYLDRPDLERHAIATLERLVAEASEESDGGLCMRHAPGSAVSGILDDQVQMAAAAIDAYEVSGIRVWLERAEALMTRVWARFRASGGGLLDREPAPGPVRALEEAVIPVSDSPTPSPNAVAAIALTRLAEHTGRAEWRRYRDELIEGIGGEAEGLSVFGATLLLAIDWAVHPVTHVVIVGDESSTRALRLAVRRTYRPRRVLTWLRPHEDTSRLPPALQAALDGRSPRVYVCVGAQCAAPTDTVEETIATLSSFSTGI